MKNKDVEKILRDAADTQEIIDGQHAYVYAYNEPVNLETAGGNDDNDDDGPMCEMCEMEPALPLEDVCEDCAEQLMKEDSEEMRQMMFQYYQDIGKY